MIIHAQKPHLLCLVAALFTITAATTTQAAVVSINSITNNANTIGVFFDVPVTLPSGTDATNYLVYNKSGVVPITGISIQTNNQFVIVNLVSNIGEFFYVDVTNVVDEATNSISDTLLGYISDYASDSIGTVGDPAPAGTVYSALRDGFDLTASGSGFGGTNDFFHFVSLPITGDFDMAVEVTRLDATSLTSKAGLAARETLTAGSRSVQTYFTPTNGANEVEVAMRIATNGITTDSGFQIGARAAASSNSWLRLTRAGDVFTAFHGTNGRDWAMSGTITQVFASTLSIGMAATSETNGLTTVASFRNFGIAGLRPGYDAVPTLSVSLSGTNLSLDWPRTLPDYTVQISTNLLDWSFLLAPILETGTNASGRRMTIATTDFESTLFARLTRVHRVIPDPPLALYTGLILSWANGNLTTASDSLLCTFQVTNAITQTSMTAVPNRTVIFSTAGSGSSLDTVLKVRRFPDLVVPCDDNSAGNLKSKQTYLTTITKTNFSMVTAVKPATPVTPTQQILVGITIQ